jgi:opacity protein-like surface antigen
MKKILSLVSIAALLATALPAAAQVKNNYIGPSISFGSGDTAIGVTSKFGVADSISVRPFAIFPSGGTVFGASATYDFNLNDGSGANPFTPYGGIGFVTTSASNSRSEVYFEIGADYDATESIMLNVNHRFRDGGFTSIGGGFRF